ncbi:hypothetical protein G6F57_020664 [Rhizopus arrhizus]|nr:hypothetical protein G6F57_020664 [Rhizopus arrhizus]
MATWWTFCSSIGKTPTSPPSTWRTWESAAAPCCWCWTNCSAAARNRKPDDRRRGATPRPPLPRGWVLPYLIPPECIANGAMPQCRIKSPSIPRFHGAEPAATPSCSISPANASSSV